MNIWKPVKCSYSNDFVLTWSQFNTILIKNCTRNFKNVSLYKVKEWFMP